MAPGRCRQSEGPGGNPGPDPRPEAPRCDLAEQRRQVLEAGRARFAALARWWAGLGPAERTAIPDRSEPAPDCESAEQIAPAEDRQKGERR